MFEIRGKTVLILGLGSYKQGSGISAALFCLRNGVGSLIVSDLRSAEQLTPTLRQLRRFGKRVEYVLGKHRLKDVRRADMIVKNPGVRHDIPALQLARSLGTPVTNDIGLFLAHKPVGMVIGVTGTRGKSTTTTLVYECVRAQFPRTWLGGNVGRSPLSFIAHMKPDDITVLELSSFMLGDLHEPQPDVAVVTNVLPDHLNYYPTAEAYKKDKEKIWKHQLAHQLVVLNADNAATKKMAAHARAQVALFGAGSGKEGTRVRSGQVFVHGEPILRVNDIRLRGTHNVSNVLAAVTVARAVGVPSTLIRRVVCGFTGLPNRLEHVRTVAGVEYYNDTTATTPDAAIAAVHAFSKKPIVIAGGNTKGLDLSAFARTLKKKASHLILLRGNANEILKGAVPKTRWVETDTVENAVAYAAGIAKKGSIVLLSPGCTWLPHMNEFERGRRFVQAVRAL